MTTRREHILATIATSLVGTTNVGTRIYRSRVEPLARAESPAIVVEPLADQCTITNSHCKIDWSLTIRVAVIVRGIIPDQQADPIVESMHAKVMADQSVGGYAISIEPRNVQFDMINADQPGGVIACDYEVRYRTSLDSLLS